MAEKSPAEQKLNPGHSQIRNLLRIAGPVTGGVGLIFMIIGLASFFSSFGSFGQPPRYFWCCFVGMPLIGVGVAMTKVGFFGAISRYFSAEAAPVAADTFNYIADETQGGVRTMASAVREGLTGGGTKVCGSCQQANESDAAFCNQCGNCLSTEIDCQACQTPNHAGSKFCDACGTALN